MARDDLFTHVMFAEIPVDDQDRAVAFYTERMGLHVERDMPYRDGWRWLELGVPGARTRILMSRRDELAQRGTGAAGGAPVLTLATPDVDAAHERLVGAGVEFTQPPATPPWNPRGRYALLRDSEGNIVLLQS